MIFSQKSLTRHSRLPAGWLLLITLLAGVLRGLWLGWQPLWWDEGYSFYFASEPLVRMVALTAQDIHPPFYYLLLHGWLLLAVDPVYGRLFSVIIGALSVPLFATLTAQLYPGRRTVLIATVLLLLNPLHLYYSQEVRMYGLALLLSLASSLFLVRAIRQMEKGRSSLPSLLLYGIFTTLCLYTLYYLGFLIAAQALWALWQRRRQGRDVGKLLASWLGIILAYLPWLLYAGLQLTAYVKHKVAADKDQPLSLAEFLLRHLSTFVVGHNDQSANFAKLETWLACLMIVFVILLSAFFSIRKMRESHAFTIDRTAQLLWISLLFPSLCAFVINQVRPFFPSNGERLLLFVLPYFLLLLAAAINNTYQRFPIRLALAMLFALELTGIFHFYTTARYAADDYRPLIRQIVQQSTGSDQFLATYPWQIGFWRAYAHADLANSAQPQLLSDGSVEWGDAVAATIEGALQQGVVWFPSLLSIGSTLPERVNNYLLERNAVNVIDHWFSETTRLDAWRKASTAAFDDRLIDFGALQINGVGFAPKQVMSANQALDVRLRWTIAAPNRRLNLSLRLQDAVGRTWLQRDYPLASHWHADVKGFVENVGLIVPPGLPPDDYRLVVGVADADHGASLTTKLANGASTLFASIGIVSVTAPQQVISPAKLPLQTALQQPIDLNGLTLLGYQSADRPILSGDQLQVRLFYQKPASDLKLFNLSVSLRERTGAWAAGWEGWSLPNYTTTIWPAGALVQVPVAFDLPASLPSGDYQLVSGLIEVANGKKSQEVELGMVSIRQRQAQFAGLFPPHPLLPAPLLGNHATLLGYDLTTSASTTEVKLYWRVEQTLLPAHHIFVHFDTSDGTTVAQSDGIPTTAEGTAPTGSWQAGEMLITLHQITGAVPSNMVIRVGLYNPATVQRLPVSVNGNVIGDAVELK